MRRGIEAALRDRIAGAGAGGEMAVGTDPDVVAATVMAVIQGLSTLARDGASRDKLQGVAGFASAARPSTRA